MAHQIALGCPNVDEEILSLAVLLHDIDEPFNDKKSHVQLSERRAQSILATIDYPCERRERIVQIIREHPPSSYGRRRQWKPRFCSTRTRLAALAELGSRECLHYLVNQGVPR